jgi:glyoxylase-like metal-dependent hydrolase (beta-lactamase superfamily II)
MYIQFYCSIGVGMTDCITAYEYSGGIVAIDSGMIRPRMAACYLAQAGDALALIEVGSNASTDRILQVIANRGGRPEEVSHLIVTHVHLDHAGGAGNLMQHLPEATLVVHPRGARHMIDPSRLEASARGVYGDEEYEKMHGALVPVDESRVLVAYEGDTVMAGDREFVFMDSPGHARHHFCVWDERTRGWFAGDTFGLSYRELDTENGPFILPTTTPVQFDPPVLIDSINRMMEYSPEFMYLTHFGRVGDVPRLAEKMKSAVERLVQFAEAFVDDDDRGERIASEMMDWLMGEARDHGVTMKDEALRELFRYDVELNTLGIEFWLDHRG